MNRLPQSFKSIGLVVTMVIWLHGCQVYRASSVAEVKEGRTYELTLTSGKRIQGKCTGVFDEYLLIRTNENTVQAACFAWCVRCTKFLRYYFPQAWRLL